MNIRVKINDDNMSFSIYKKSIDAKDINNTNVIDITTMVFKDDYFTENNELICSFLNTIIIKNNINSIIIKNNEIAYMVLNVINKISHIKNIYLKEDSKIRYDAAFLILKSNNIEYVECYSMDYFIFDEINTRTNIKIKLIDETVYFNDFMDKNNLGTYSKIFYKKSINIDYKLSKVDINYLEMFFNLNNNLNCINLYYYDKEILTLIFNLIDKYKKYNIKINIYQKKNDTLNEYVNYFKDNEKMCGKYKIKHKFKYTKEFVSKNIVKQFNLNFAKFLLIIIIFIIIGIIIVDSNYKSQNKKNIEYFINMESNTDVVTPENITQEDENLDYQKIYHTVFKNNYDELIKINSDIIGWLKVNHTNINFPIVHTTNNEYYIRHTIKKNYNYYGWPFADYRNKFPNLSQNTIIYGHSNKYGIVFGTLRNVLRPSWYKNENNQIISFDVKEKSYKFKIFSIYTIPVTNDYLITNFNKKEFNEYINMITKRSIYNFNTNLEYGDKILTLTTCYPTTDDRLVVHAKLLK